MQVMASQAANVGNYKAIARAETIQAWQINACPAPTRRQQGQDWPQAEQTYASGAVSLMLPPVKTGRLAGQLDDLSGTNAVDQALPFSQIRSPVAQRTKVCSKEHAV